MASQAHYRASPFRRPESPASPSPLRQSTPNPAPIKMPNNTTSTAPSRLARTLTPAIEETTANIYTPRCISSDSRESRSSPGRMASLSPGFGARLTSRNSTENHALSKLHPAQVRELREGFQILDRDNDGQVGREDVADMLTQLGLAASSSDLAAFFPPSAPQTATLPSYLNSLASILGALSPPSELLSAFSAFDEDDNGEVDLAELRDALLQTAPDPGEKHLTAQEIDNVMNGFTGRRAFGKHAGCGMGKRGEVFKYQEFVACTSGGGGNDGKGDSGADD